MPPSPQLVANLFLVVFTRVPICVSGTDLCQVCTEVWLTNVPLADYTVYYMRKTGMLPDAISLKKMISYNSYCEAVNWWIHFLSFQPNRKAGNIFFHIQTTANHKGQTLLWLELVSGIIVLLATWQRITVTGATDPKRITCWSNKPANLVMVFLTGPWSRHVNNVWFCFDAYLWLY